MVYLAPWPSRLLCGATTLIYVISDCVPLADKTGKRNDSFKLGTSGSEVRSSPKVNPNPIPNPNRIETKC